MNKKNNNKKNIGIITFHRAHNYGAFLQVYALQNQVKRLNNDCVVINYNDKNIMKSYKLFKISKNPIKFMKLFLASLKNYKRNKKRYDNFNNCINENLNLTIPYNSFDKLEKEYPKLDCYITGSDQVWNSNITKGLQDSYTLNFGEQKTIRISYAASIGNSTLTNDEIEQYRTKISKLNYVSVREEDAKNMLETIIDKQIEVVLDPTLLNTKQEWENIINKENVNCENEKYILAYVVEKDEEYVKIVNYLSQKTGLRVIHFAREDNGIENVIRSAYTDNPFEFVNLIKNAEYVVCTSFHATVFSIIFNKKFFVVPHKKTGSRVTNLLDKMRIENRIVYTLDEFKNIDYNLDTNWNNVEKILNKERESSIKWLQKAIEGEIK